MTYEEAKRLAYRKLAMRAYHSLEMKDRLLEKGAPLGVVGQVIEELKALGYLNDPEWIVSSIRSLTARKYGPKMISYKLMSKGIPEEEFQISLEEIACLQHESIRRLLETKYKSRQLIDFKERQKVIAALVRKGFDLPAVLQTILSFDN